MPLPPRPAWNHTEIKAAAASEIIEDVQHWARMANLEKFADNEREFLALVTLAIQESSDSYNAARYLEDIYDWPVDRNLVSIIDVAYARMKFIAGYRTHDWVMENKVRFPASKGMGVRARIGDFEFMGKVVSVVSTEARAIATIIGKSDKKLSVNAEEVMESFQLKPESEGPKGFPTGPGGTPISMVGT